MIDKGWWLMQILKRRCSKQVGNERGCKAISIPCNPGVNLRQVSGQYTSVYGASYCIVLRTLTLGEVTGAVPSKGSPYMLKGALRALHCTACGRRIIQHGSHSSDMTRVTICCFFCATS